MVRVIPVHNFSGQSVAAIEEPTASCTAKCMGQEMLLLALSSHCVEVHRLSMPQPKLSTVFPTVDLVHQIIHCSMENYIATVESKVSRDGTSVNNFVRIYVNWSLEGNQNQAMRARIAGRVTPSSNRIFNSLEMIELPLNGQPTRIAACQVTGNLLVATGKSAVLHELKVERQQLSKQKFIDFEARPWSLGFSFSPTSMEIAEDFFSIMDASNFMVFRLVNQLYEDIDLLSSSTNSSVLSKPLHSVSKEPPACGTSDPRTLDAGETLSSPGEPAQQNADPRNANSSQTSKIWNSKVSLQPITNDVPYIDWDLLVSNKNEEHRLKSLKLLSEESQITPVDFPALRSETNKPGSISNPFISSAPELNVVIKTSSPADGWSENYVVKKLLQLKISALINVSQKTESSEYFTCCLLKPMYLKTESNSSNTKKCTLRSDKYKNLNGVNCVICTAQEGYLFYFSTSSKNPETACCTSYPFTAPVTHVVLENTILHALTEAGLESYTLRLSQKLTSSVTNAIENLNPNEKEPVSLIGLCPFMGVQKLLHVNKFIILLTQAEDHWTLYTLSLPSPEDLYYDMLNAAINHKTSSPSTYRHLLSEAYTIVTLAKEVENNIDNNAGSKRSEAKNSETELDALHRKCCALLADVYINSESPTEWQLCIPYFRMSRLKAADVLSQKSIRNAPGLSTYLMETLLNLKSGPEADALFQVYNVVELISSTSKKNLIKLIFGSLVLREYATEKLISILQSLDQDDSTRFALVLLYVQADRQDQAEKIIKDVTDRCILSMSLTHWHCLFDVTLERQSGHVIATFSDLSVVMMRQKSLVFADILVRVIDANAVMLHQILQIFLAHLPSRVGRDGHIAAAVLQLFVETYLRNYFEKKCVDSSEKKVDHSDYSIVEAFKILVRSYLGKLSQTNVYTIEDNRNVDVDISDEKEYLFENMRPLYLDKMRPNTEESKNSVPTKSKGREKIVRREALKLQALLASGYLPAECLQEIEEFLKAHSVDGDLSFRVLSMGNLDGTMMLLENCPQALLQYAKVIYQMIPWISSLSCHSSQFF